MIQSRSTPFKGFSFVVFYVAATFSLLLVSCGGGSSGSISSGGGGGGGTTGPASSEYLWETSMTSGNLTYATINTTTGALGSPTVAGSPAGSDSGDPSVAVSSAGNFVYAFYMTSSELEAFEVTGPGLQVSSLASTGVQPALQIPYEESMVIHPSGKFLYVVVSDSQKQIQEVSLNSTTGAMTPGSVVSETANFAVAVVDPSGQFLFAGDVAAGKIFVYQINQTTGALSAAANSPFTLPSGEQPSFMAVGGSGTSLFLYASLYTSVNNTNGGGIAAFSVNTTTGALTVVAGSPFLAGNNAPQYICTNPSRSFLYSSNAKDGTINGCSINPASGALSSVPGSPFAAGSVTGVIIVDPSGQFLYVSNPANSTIYGFEMNATTGSLTALSGSPFPSVAQPEGLTMMAIQ